MRQPGLTLLNSFYLQHIGVAGDTAGHAAGDDKVVALVESEDFGCLLFCSVEEDFGGVVGVAERGSNAPGEGKFSVGFFVGGEA